MPEVSANTVEMSLWKPGQSGNPSGRPKIAHKFKKDCQEHAAEVLQRLIYWLRQDDPAYSIRAGELILSYGLGKPVQQIELETTAKAYVIAIPAPDASNTLELSPEQWQQQHTKTDNIPYQSSPTESSSINSLDAIIPSQSIQEPSHTNKDSTTAKIEPLKAIQDTPTPVKT